MIMPDDLQPIATVTVVVMKIKPLCLPCVDKLNRIPELTIMTARNQHNRDLVTEM